jgi:hypothetical protein
MSSTAKREATSPLAHAAQVYAARGWSVIPMQARGKRPLVAWRELQQRRAAAEEIDSWYRRWPDANVGIVTGRISGLVVIDVDVQHGGPDSVAALEALHGALPPTVEALTGGGGRHLYYAHPGPLVPNRVAVRPGIDVRGDGGCVVAPPSMHPSGRRYEWVAGHDLDQHALAPPPVHFFGRSVAAEPPGRTRAQWRRLVRDGIAPGQRNNTIASLTGHLLRHEIDPDVVHELMLAWNRSHCRPPLSDDEVAQVVASIARLHERSQGMERGP